MRRSLTIPFSLLIQPSRPLQFPHADRLSHRNEAPTLQSTENRPEKIISILMNFMRDRKSRRILASSPAPFLCPAPPAGIGAKDHQNCIAQRLPKCGITPLTGSSAIKYCYVQESASPSTGGCVYLCQGPAVLKIADEQNFSLGARWRERCSLAYM